MLRPLLAGRIVLTPSVTAEGRFYAFSGPVSYGGLVAGLIGTGAGVITVVPPG